ncbi:MAG: hypothetical protein IJF97_08585 [Eggerthellaceae bacterium]|nr:hypothetical protein [Eggerthellaceae bacterium]MBQ6455292.1 hypothetical protein [Eggerthellaceae bacterium]
MANKVNAAKKKVRKNERTRYERVVRHRQVLEREKYVEKALARTCNIYFVCFLLAVVLVVGATIWVFVAGGNNMLLLGINVAVGIVLVPLCIYQYNQYHHMAEEVAMARQASGFRFPEDYSARTRQARDRVAGVPGDYSRATLLYAGVTIIAVAVGIYLFSTSAHLTQSLTSLLLVAAVFVVAVIAFVMFLFNLLNYLDAIALQRALVKIEQDAEAEFGQKREVYVAQEDSEGGEDAAAAYDEAEDVVDQAADEVIEQA